MEKIYRTVVRSPIGDIEISGTEREICSVDFVEGKERNRRKETVSETSPAIERCARQLDEYFRGGRQTFDLELRLSGSPFQLAVWRHLLTMGFGETASYGDIAAAMGRPLASRAVGNANRLNPIGIIVPCHRVIGRSGDLVGNGGGLWRKEWLLEHEKKSLKSRRVPGTLRTKPSIPS